MKQYIYQADTYCEECAEAIMRELPVPDGADPNDERTYDSDEYPKGPYDDDDDDEKRHVGPSDSVDVCQSCLRFLENRLTQHGLDRLVKQIADVYPRVTRTPRPLTEWAMFYQDDPRLTRYQRALIYDYLRRYYNDHTPADPHILRQLNELATFLTHAHGGYPYVYYDEQWCSLCPSCADDDYTSIIACDLHEEGDPIICEQCNRAIESAYGPIEEGVN